MWVAISFHSKSVAIYIVEEGLNSFLEFSNFTQGI
jgi:hypothetical protein